MAASLKNAEVSFNRSTTIESFSLGDQLRVVFILHSLARTSIFYTPDSTFTSISNCIHYYYEWNALACLSKTKKVDITALLSTHYKSTQYNIEFSLYLKLSQLHIVSFCNYISLTNWELLMVSC